MRSRYTPKRLNLPTSRSMYQFKIPVSESPVYRALFEVCKEAEGSDYLFYSELGDLDSATGQGGVTDRIPRFVFLGPGSDDEPVRIAIFAAIHGDEPETALASLEFLKRLLKDPERARGYQIFVYPICNPTGILDGTRHSRSGVDLNRQFWSGSPEPEVYYLERELGVLGFKGVIALHADDTADGVYAFVRGATLTEGLAKPAIEAAAAFLPRATGEVIDGFPAKNALIYEHCYEGVLSNPAELHPAPFEIIFETPQRARAELQVQATVAALDRILEEYRPFLSIQQNL